MISNRQSFFVSFGLHAAVLIVLLLGGVMAARHALKSRPPIELDLLAPVETNAGNQSAAEQPEETKPVEKIEPDEKPEIVERRVEDSTYNPASSVDLSDIPKIKREQFREYKPTKVSIEGTGAAGGGSNYGSLIVAACKRNWTPPGQGVLGRSAPNVLVSITVARDGRILGQRVVRSSGNAALDRSVLEAVEQSNPLPAFPRELTGVQRDFEIRFVPED